MIRMPHLPDVQWDYRDQMRQVDLGGGGTAYYVYDGAGHRVRKVHEHNGSTVEVRIYVGEYEFYRKRNGSGLTLERETLYIMDGQRRVVMAETKTIDEGAAPFSPTSVARYQLDNHLDSACLELDDQGAVITYEEYHPYGTTSWQAPENSIDVSRKRYRYTGKEKDEETGLYYHGARYYACWLGRWVSADSSMRNLGSVSGGALFLYVAFLNSPINYTDPEGKVAEGVIVRQPGSVAIDLKILLKGDEAEGDFDRANVEELLRNTWGNQNRGWSVQRYDDDGTPVLYRVEFNISVFDDPSAVKGMENVHVLEVTRTEKSGRQPNCTEGNKSRVTVEKDPDPEKGYRTRFSSGKTVGATIAHEIGHALGLPDDYKMDQDNSNSDGSKYFSTVDNTTYNKTVMGLDARLSVDERLVNMILDRMDWENVESQPIKSADVNDYGGGQEEMKHPSHYLDVIRSSGADFYAKQEARRLLYQYWPSEHLREASSRTRP